MPSAALLGLPLAHYITICFNYSFLTNFLSMPPFNTVSRAHSLILQVIIFLSFSDLLSSLILIEIIKRNYAYSDL